MAKSHVKPNPKPNKFNDLLSQNIAREQSAQQPPAARVQNTPKTDPSAPDTQWIDEEQIDDNPYQPRQRMSSASLRQLMQSLDENGQLQAARVRPHPSKAGRFQLVFGHRRREAVRRGANAGSRQSAPEHFRDQLRCEIAPATDEQMLEAAYAENEDREDFSVFDRAHYFQTLRQLNAQLSPGTNNAQPSENAREISWEELAKTRALPLSPRAIRRLVQVLELPQTVQNRLAEANLGHEDRPESANEKHCRALLLLQNQPAQTALLDAIIQQNLSGNEALRRAETFAAQAKSATKSTIKSAATAATPSTNDWQNWLKSRLQPTLLKLENHAQKAQTKAPNAAQTRRQQEQIAAQLTALAEEIRAQIDRL